MFVILSEAKNPGSCCVPELRRLFASLRVTDKAKDAVVIEDHISSSVFRVSIFEFRVSIFQFPFSSFEFRFSNFEFRHL